MGLSMNKLKTASIKKPFGNNNVNWGGVQKGAVAGGLVAGPWGALAGGALGNHNANKQEAEKKAAAKEADKQGAGYQELYNGMPTARKFTDDKGNITGLPNRPQTLGTDGKIDSKYSYNPTMASHNDYQKLNIDTPKNLKDDGTLQDQFKINPWVIGKDEIERVGYQDFSAQRASEERGIDKQLDNSYQNTLNSLSSQGGLSAADRLAAGKGIGRDRANAQADMAGRFGQIQSDNRYNTDVKNAEFGNAFLDTNAKAINDSQYYNSEQALGEGWKGYDAQFTQGKYNTDLHNSIQDKNLDRTNDAQRTNSERSLDQTWKGYGADADRRMAGINQSGQEFNNDLAAWGKKGEMYSAEQQARLMSQPKKPSTTDKMLMPWEHIGKK